MRGLPSQDVDAGLLQLADSLSLSDDFCEVHRYAVGPVPIISDGPNDDNQSDDQWENEKAKHAPQVVVIDVLTPASRDKRHSR